MEGATANGALHKDEGTGQGHLEPIAQSKGSLADWSLWGELGDEHAVLAHGRLQSSVVPWINPLQWSA
jgi:hypothetical protein